VRRGKGREGRVRKGKGGKQEKGKGRDSARHWEGAGKGEEHGFKSSTTQVQINSTNWQLPVSGTCVGYSAG
jgi:hypothetical protein